MSAMKITGRCPVCDEAYGVCRCHKGTMEELARGAKEDMERMLAIANRKDLVPIAEDPDFTGDTQFLAWFEAIWPRPKSGSRAQFSNWKFKYDMAHAGWCACERLALESIRTSQFLKSPPETPPTLPPSSPSAGAGE